MQEGQFKVIDDYLCVKMPKEIDHHNAEILSKKVDKIILGKNVNHVVFDFMDTDFMDSSGLGLIMGRFALVQKYNASFAVLDPSPAVLKIIRLAGMEKMITILKTKEKNT